jgi:hypothetical protein
MAQGLFTLKQQLLGVIQKAWNTSVNQLKPSAVDYLVVAGGGGGGSEAGGGAGGLLQGSVPVVTGSAITVTVGSGGAGGVSGGSGTSSVFGSISVAGGGGTTNNGVGVAGGSGGGGATSTSPTNGGGQGIAGQGNAGGGGANNAFNAAGGGGGAGTVGLASSSGPTGGSGGAGIASAISGTVTPYAGGGGGSGYTGTQGSGGVGGGGAGSNSTTAGSGTVNTGGGGGGSWSGTKGTGGSGIVIVSYPDIYAGAASTTGSPTVSTSGSGSIAFSGTSQYITTPSASAIAFSTNNFTVEGFVYFTSIGSTGAPKGVLQLSTNSAGINASAGNSVGLGSNATGGKWEIYAGGTSTVAASAAPVANTWYHFAIVKNSGTTVLYINGTSVLSVADSTTYTGTYLAVGAYYDPGYGIPGYVSNVRIVNGVAVYTGAFTPPAAPLTTTQPAGTNISAITGTSTALLLNTVSGAQFADRSVNSYILTRTGSPTWNQLSPFATGLGYKNRVYTWTSSGSVTF